MRFRHGSLASVVSGFGYHVVAWDGKTVSPCVGIDTSGDLYFFVKPGTKSFIIRGRDLPGDTPGFPGEIVVQVKSAASTQTASPAPSHSDRTGEEESHEEQMESDSGGD